MAIRFASNKIYTRKFKQPHYDKKLILAACEPEVALDRTPHWERCKKPTYNPKVEPHPLEVIQSEELRQEMAEAAFIAFYHINSMVAEDYRVTRNTLTKNGFKLSNFTTQTYKLAIEGTKFESLMPQIELESTHIVTCKERKVANLLQLDKKMHTFVLLFGIVEDRILRKDELVEYSQMPSLDQARAQLCQTLELSARMVTDNLGHHLTSLSANLEQYVKQKQADKETKEEV